MKIRNQQTPAQHPLTKANKVSEGIQKIEISSILSLVRDIAQTNPVSSVILALGIAVSIILQVSSITIMSASGVALIISVFTLGVVSIILALRFGKK